MIIDIHTHNDIVDKNVISVKNLYPNEDIIKKENLYYSVGVHPWDVDEFYSDEKFEYVEKLSKDDRVLFIGETGLDKKKGDFIKQKEIFIRHIELSEMVQKPVIIHCVKSFSELLEIKKSIKPKQNWIIHGFSKGKDLAEQLVNNGCLLSFGEAIFANSKNINAFLETPLDKFFLETDDKKILIEDVYLRAKQLKNIKLADLEMLLEVNFKSLKLGV